MERRQFRRCAKAALCFVLPLLAALPAAKAQTADVRSTVELIDGNTYATQTRAVRIRARVANAGPDTLPALNARMFTTTSSANSLDVVVVPPCDAMQGAGAVVNLTWVVGALPSGASTVCDIELRARATAQSAIFIFVAEAIVAGFVDPIRGNEQSSIDLLSVSPIDIVQDMVLTIQSPPGLLPTQPGFATADLVLTNRGPDSFPPNWLHLVRSEVFRIAGAGQDPIILGSTADPDCQLFADDVGNSRIVQINYLNPIPPGTSQTCAVRVAARPGAAGGRSLRWDVGRLTPGLLETHPADNTAFLVMQFSPAIIPVDARWALLLLVAGLATFGLLRSRRCAH